MALELDKSDQELVIATLENRNSFSALIQKYEAAIRRYVRRLGCVEADDINDVIQEIFIKVYINLNDYDQKLKFSSWLYRIAHNETISFFRKKNLRVNVLNLSDEDIDDFFEQIDDGKDYVKIAYQKDDARITRDLLSSLNPKYKDVLVLRFLEEKSYSEISEILKLPEGTVATLINRGKKELKIGLEAKGIKSI